jgi:superfamily II DNA/RNA helicase
MVFVNATKSMRPLLALLKRAAVRASALHGKLEQREREEALASFKSAKTPVLLCSDLVARGLDVRQLDAVINFDLPATMEQYVHRSGRTGRSGASGLVITLLRPGPDAEAFARGVARLRSRAGTAVPSELDELLAARAESAARPGDGPEAPDGPQDPEPDAAERAQMSLLDFAAAMA